MAHAFCQSIFTHVQLPRCQHATFFFFFLSLICIHTLAMLTDLEEELGQGYDEDDESSLGFLPPTWRSDLAFNLSEDQHSVDAQHRPKPPLRSRPAMSVSGRHLTLTSNYNFTGSTAFHQ